MSLCLCIPCFSMVAHAEDGRISFTDPKTAVGEMVNVDCAIRSTSGDVGEVEMKLTYDSAYLRSFGILPTLFSYRGYDTAMIFAPAMYGDIEYDLEDRRFTPLQTTYLFSRPEGRANHVNHNWTRVNYHKDFTITIE